MATVDLTNEITPKHPYRPVRLKLTDLRTAIKTKAPAAYSDEYLDRCNRNDLVSIARTVGVVLPALT